MPICTLYVQIFENKKIKKQVVTSFGGYIGFLKQLSLDKYIQIQNTLEQDSNNDTLN